MISVIIPTYNRDQCVSRAIDSVLMQTYSDIELIIVDDGSTDRTEDMVRQYSDPRIRYIKQPHSGACVARNRGIEEAKGEYIAFQDSDDEWCKCKLERQMDCMTRENADIVFCAFERKPEGTEQGERIPYDAAQKSRFICISDLLPDNICSTQTLLFKRVCFVEDQFNPELKRLQDWELMLRMTKKWRVYFDNETLVTQYLQTDSITSNPEILTDALRQVYKLVSILYKEQESLLKNVQKENQENAEALDKYKRAYEDYLIILNSDIWRATKPLRSILDGMKSALGKSRSGELALNGIRHLKQYGISKTVEKVRWYYRNGGRGNSNVQREYILEENNADVRKYERDIDYSRYKTDIKVLALYLPQFHEIKENNEWWGPGFTEWTNVRKGTARFEGHNQPRVPDKEFGYYDLSDVRVLKKQVALAKRHGIYGFAMYYYWFSGHRLLEKPMDMLLEHIEIDFPFMAVWANENWTRTWDGETNNILIEQKYSKEDAERFILDLKKYMDDRRYIRVNGKPVIGVYAPLQIPNVEWVFKKWRETAHKCGIGDILIWVCAGDTDDGTRPISIENIIDGVYEFPPRGKGFVPHCEVPDDGTAYDYNALLEASRGIVCKGRKVPFFRGTMMEWDNSARKKKNYHCWTSFTPERFYIWNRIAVRYLRESYEKDYRFLFVNAWNEWGEGTYLEPDQCYGYACINALSKAIFDIPYSRDEGTKKVGSQDQKIMYLGCGIGENSVRNWDNRLKRDCRIAIQVHVFYPKLIDEIVAHVNQIPYPYDLYISTNDETKKNAISAYVKKHCNARACQIQVFSNKGRDVVPFVYQMKPVIGKYKYICHLHTKKSLHTSNLGDVWRRYLYENLMGSKEIIQETLYLFETSEDIGVIFPDNLDVVRPFVEWGSNKNIAEQLMKRMNLEINFPDNIMFPAGNMFWARTDAVKNVFAVDYQDSDFPEEEGQTDGTVMHAIERMWLYVSEANGYGYKTVRSLSDNRPLNI